MSLFGIYCSGKPPDETLLTEYLRDNLHRKIQQNQAFPNDTILALRSSISEIFTSIQMQRNPMLVTIFKGSELIVVNSQSGPKAIRSSRGGQCLQRLTNCSPEVDIVELDHTSYYYNIQQNCENITTYSLHPDDDFIIMGPEPILEDACRITWKTI